MSYLVTLRVLSEDGEHTRGIAPFERHFDRLRDAVAWSRRRMLIWLGALDADAGEIGVAALISDVDGEPVRCIEHHVNGHAAELSAASLRALRGRPTERASFFSTSDPSRTMRRSR